MSASCSGIIKGALKPMTFHIKSHLKSENREVRARIKTVRFSLLVFKGQRKGWPSSRSCWEEGDSLGCDLYPFTLALPLLISKPYHYQVRLSASGRLAT